MSHRYSRIRVGSRKCSRGSSAASAGRWDTYPALSNLLLWYASGIFARTWVYALAAERLGTSWYASRHGDLSQPASHEVTLTFIGSTALAATMTRSDTQRRRSITLQ